MDGRIKTIEEIAQAKLEYRRRRAQLPFEEKIRIVVELQKRRAPIMEARGKKQRIWQLSEEER